MTKEDRQLLFADLCGRLPYPTLCYCKWTKDAPNGTSGCVQEVSTYLLEELMIIGDQNYECQICEIKPYLRPMSSMTEEESAELSNIISEWFDKELFYLTEEPMIEYALSRINYSINPKLFDWLNKNMFDYRGLIEKGLAIEVTENNPYKDKL